MKITFSGENTEENPIPVADAYLCIDCADTHPAKHGDLFFNIHFDDLWPSTVERLGWEECMKRKKIFNAEHHKKVRQAFRMMRASGAASLHINCQAGISRSAAMRVMAELYFNYTEPTLEDFKKVVEETKAGVGRVPRAETYPNVYILKMLEPVELPEKSS